jgi:hypothetical protein
VLRIPTMKKYLNEGHLGLSVGVIAFIYFISTGLTREKITSDKDLIELKGKYVRHSFTDNEGFQNFTYQYYIWTENQTSTFQVKAEYLRIFKKADFIKEVNPRDTIVFTIPKRQLEKLSTADNVVVTSIESQGQIYLNKNETLGIEKELAKSNTDYYIGTGLLIAGLFAYFRRRLAKTTANNMHVP